MTKLSKKEMIQKQEKIKKLQHELYQELKSIINDNVFTKIEARMSVLDSMGKLCSIAAVSDDLINYFDAEK